MTIFIGVGIFFAIVLLIEGGYYVFIAGRKPEQKKIRKRLRLLTRIDSGDEEVEILRKKLLSEVSWFNQFLLRIPSLNNLDLFLEQANTRYPLGFYLLLSVLLLFCGYMAGFLLTINLMASFVFALLAGSLPFCFLYFMKKKRMQKFERQLPEALDMIVRALKAGHAFTGGIK